LANFDKFINTFDPSNNAKGKQFEKFCKWFLENDPVWKSQVKKVWLWDDWPGRWGADLGIDLVFQHTNGNIWAVQAKCYSQIYPVTKNDMNTFLSESNRPQIQQRLLMASTDIIGSNTRKVCAGQDKKVTFQLYSDFLDSKLDFPKDISKLGKAKLLPKPKPRPHQANAIKDVIKGFKKHDRGQMIMACGTGKTFTTLWIKEKLKAESTLILLPSLSLLSQTLKEWCSAANQSFQSLAVCSDETVTRGAEEDAIAESTQDLSFPVSSDPKVIAKFLKLSGSKVVFSTYQSSPMIAEAMKGRSVNPFDLVICDEAHRCVGKAGSNFTTILDDKKIKVKQKLFTTATPRTYSSNVKKAAKDNEIIITGMDDEKVFGSVFHKLSFGEAIELKLLTDYQVALIVVDKPMIKESISNREFLEVEDGVSVDAESLAVQIGVLKAIKDYDLKRLITFHGRVKRAENFSKDILSIAPFIPKKDLPKGILKTDYVSGKMPTNKRRQKLEQLKDLYDCDRQILSNARCLSEGVDVPALEGIAIIDPRKSQVDIVQTVGRAIRLSGNKKIGTIIMPVFIENSEDPELAIENSNFKPVYDVLNALKSHDENLAFELDEIRTQMGKRKVSTGPSNKIPKVSIDLPKRLSLDFSESIKTILVEHSTGSWNFYYGLLQKYKKENNSVEVPRVYILPDGFRLGAWIGSQRVNRKKNAISSMRIAKLDKLGFIWDALDAQWEKAYEAFQQYIKENNSQLVPLLYKTSWGLTLGSWVSKQRQYNRENKLSPEKIARLDKLGFAWDFEDAQWAKAYNKYQQYIKDNNSAEIPRRYQTPNGYKLGSWVSKQRQYNRENKLSPEKIARLDKLGFVWDFDYYDAQWAKAYNKYQQYIKENNSVEVPSAFILPDGFRLGAWIKSHRANRKKNTISSMRIAKLDKLGFIWDAGDTQWAKAYNKYQQYIKDNNSVEVPSAFILPDGFCLGAWAAKQSKYKKENKLSPEKIARLDKLGFVWDDYWEKAYEAFQQYIKENNSVEVPNGFVLPNGYKLGSWVIRQRQYNRKNKLSPEKIARLDKLGFVWDSGDAQWAKAYSKYEQYIKENNSVEVPRVYILPDGFRLGGWIGRQREKRKKNAISSMRIAKLDKLGFIWKIKNPSGKRYQNKITVKKGTKV